LNTPQLIDLENKTPLAPAIRKADGWSNIVSGMGTAGDKRIHTTFTPDLMIPIEMLAATYMQDGLAASIIDLFADDLTREWGVIENDPLDKDKIGIITKEMERLDIKSGFNIAEKWARLSGGSLLIIGAIDGKNPETPLNVKSIKSIEYTKVIDLSDILTSQCEFNTDLTSPEYGKIDTYSIGYRIGNEFIQRRIHASRCIPFFGKRVPQLHKGAGLSPEMRYWGMSELQPIWPYLRAYQDAFGAVSAVLNELVIGKYKFSDLDEMLAEDNGKRFQARMEAIETMKSILHGVMLGTDEDYIRDTISLSGTSDVLDRFMMNVSAVTRYPVTKLFGRSASGLNATGENDQKNYYDSVRARQNSEWPYVQKLVDMIAAWKGIKEYTPFKWNPLFQLTEEQKANVARIEAETYRTLSDGDDRYINQGVILQEDAYKLRFEVELGPRASSEFENMEPPVNVLPDGTPLAVPGEVVAVPKKGEAIPKKGEVIPPKGKVPPKKGIPKK
jgi:phage-related protein (TIGR01555 family)